MLRIFVRLSLAAFVLLAALLAAPRPSLAGPPLLCHPFDIGEARSLPWDGAAAWWAGQPGYDIKSVTADTTALLTPSVPVLVRMETLRRAALYASQDPAVARQLLAAFTDRAQRAAADDPFAPFDAGYLTETFRQIARLGDWSELGARARIAREVVGTADGYALIQRTLSLRPDDPSVEFAAALVARGTGQPGYGRHAAKARQGAAKDALLSRNIKQLL